MNKLGKKAVFLIVLCTLIIAMTPMRAFANAAEPPSLTILVKNPPEDLSITLISDENRTESSVRKVAWEGYYSFYSRDLQKENTLVFKITTGSESFEWTIDEPLQGYNNVFTLNVAERMLTPGKYPFRAAILVAMRLLITLLIEGFIFFFFRFKEKKSWLVFLVVNLVTQGALNIWLNVEGSLLPSYLFITLVIGEILVFAVELVAFPLLIKEHKNSRVFVYVFVANLVSLIAGGYIISVLPV